MNHSNEIVHVLDKIFNENNCHELCLKHRFIERATSKLKGHEFIKVMVVPNEGVQTDSLKGLCKRMREFNTEANLSAQALCERINDSSSKTLMQAVFAQILFYARTKTIQRCPKLDKKLSRFNRVLIEDSTVAKLHEKLSKEYEGTNRGGTGAKSQVKIDLIHDIMKGEIIDAEIYEGKEPDQSLAGRIINYVQPDDLVIRDLGYFVLKHFKAIAEKAAYFLSRLQPNVKIYLNREDKEPLDLDKYLLKHYPNHMVIEFNGFLGDEKTETRIILYRLPKEVVEKRQREANKRAKDTGRTMSKGKKICLHFAIFVTNVPKEFLEAEIIGTIYRLRWDIELIFKRWKGQLQVDYLKGLNKNRVDCLIWSRLCMVVIIEIIRGHVAGILQKSCEYELSDAKLIDYLLRNSSLCFAIKKKTLESYLQELEQDVSRMLAKDKRFRKTMRERVFEGESYYGIQNIENQQVA